LTFNATSVSSSRLVLAGLKEYECGAVTNAPVRRLFVSPEIHGILGGKLSQPVGFPCAEADKTIARYRSGYIVHVTRKPAGKGDFKWLNDHDEVWVMHFKGAGANWRLFGRFAKAKLFVGLICIERSELKPWSTYQKKGTEMIADWEKRFPDCEPFRGSKFEDYLGDMVYNKDD
jgi:hypothetical protein